MNLTLAETATKPSGYLPIRAAKVKSMPSAPFVRKTKEEPAEAADEKPAPAPLSFRHGNPVWYETDKKYAIQSAPEEEEPEEKATKRKYRRLRNLSRDVQRPLESRLYHLRRVYHWSDKRIAKELNLHPADLNALAATHGEV